MNPSPPHGAGAPPGRTDLRGCPVDPWSLDDLVALLSAKMESGRGPMHHHVSMNAAKWVAMRRDPALRAIVRAAGSVGADGASIVRSAGAPERVPGVEVAERLLARAGSCRVALVGGRPAIVEAVAADLAAQGVSVVLARDGYFAPDGEAAVVDAIRGAAPALLLLALGTPKAEHFVGRWAPLLAEVPVVMGVGGAFDVWAGAARRAPPWVGRAGLEWAWRFAESPRARFGRAIGDSARFLLHEALGTRLG